MNICILSDYNIAGGLTALMRGINKYSEHNARCIIWHNDHFNYDEDIILDECGDNFAEACQIVHNADFFYFGRFVFNFPGANIISLINPSNCLVAYFGSELRNNSETFNKFHKKTNIKALTGSDFTITPLLAQSFYHIQNYFTPLGDMDEKEIPKAEKPKDIIRIAAGSAGSKKKGYDILDTTIKKLKSEGLPVELDIISGISNKECLKRKQKAHITFTSLFGGWGLSGVESMWLGHPVVSCIDPFVLSLYPDQPTVIVDKDNLYEELKILITNPEKITEIGQQSKNFAKKHFSTKELIKRNLYLIDLIMHYDEHIKGGKKAENIYNF